MKNTYTNFALAVFVLAMTLGLASATINLNGIPSELSQESSSFTINIAGNANESINIYIEDLVNNQISTSPRVDFSFPGVVSLNENGSGQAIINYTVQENFEFKLAKEYSTTLTLNGTESGEKSYTLNFKETSFCNNIENNANIKLGIEDVEIISGYGDSDDYWYLRDEVEIELTLEPTSFDIEDVEVEWVLYNTDGVEIDDGDFSVSDIDEDDEETIYLTLKLDSNINDFGGEDAILYIRAIGNIDDSDSSSDGDESCDYDRLQVDVNSGDDFVIADNLEINDEKVLDDDYNTISCGQQITLTGEFWNIGEDDQDKVSVELYSKNLEVYKKFEYDSIDAFESEDFTYTFEVPKDLEADVYTFTIEVFNEDNDLFENDEDEVSKRAILLEIEESCVVEEPTITAELVGEAESGKEITVNAYVRNNNNRESDFVMTAEDLDWATLKNIEPRIFTLSAGEATEVTFTFEANKDAVGEYTFDIQALVEGDNTFSQPASINVEKGSFDLEDLMTKENLQIAGIVLLNLILLVAIIIVARKVLKRK